jgi:predicted glycoside hydrolase/deacetylase ChbG (UPF0249 family)
MARLLIVNADDYGLSPGVCTGILQAAHVGIVSSTTVMANLVEPEDLDVLIKCGMPAGAHLNVTCGPAMTAYPSQLLDDRGWFIKDLENTAQLIENLGAVEQEWSTQVEYLLRRGLKITHLDSHHHAHLQPTLFELSMMMASDLGVGLRAGGSQAEWAAGAGVHSPAELALDYFGEGRIGGRQLMRILETAGDGPLEIMCHPGCADLLLEQRSSYVREREAELEVLGDPELQSIVEGMGWKLGDYGDLAEYHAETA